MLKSQVNKAIIDNKTIKDELDDVSELLYGHFGTFLITSLIWSVFVYKILTQSKNTPILHWGSLILFSVFGQLLHLSIRQREGKLVKLDSNQLLDENIEAIKKLSSELGLSKIKDDLNYFQFYKKHGFNIPTYKIVLIPFDNCIYVNVRTVGTSQGRLPYNFGFCTIFQKKVVRKLKLLL